MHSQKKKMYVNRENNLSGTQPELFLLYTLMGFKSENKTKVN